MTDYTDFELIKLMREKDDKQAFQLLYNKYWDKLFVIAIRKIHDEAAAGDIIQDLFITIWSKRNELKINDNVDLYLYTALKNRVLNFYKKKQLEVDKISQFAKNVPDKTASDAEDIFAYKEIEVLITREVNSMPDKMREIFMMSRNEQLSSKKISDILSISDQTVRNQISKAIKRLKIILEKYRIKDNRIQ